MAIALTAPTTHTQQHRPTRVVLPAGVTPLALQVPSHDPDHPDDAYVVTATSCTCPHFRYRVALDPEKYGQTCKHMDEVFHLFSLGDDRDLRPVRVGSVVTLDLPGFYEGEVMGLFLDPFTGQHVMRVDNGVHVRHVPLRYLDEVVAY